MRRTVLCAALLVGLAGCSGRPTIVYDKPPQIAVADLVRSAWISDGAGGYFTDKPWSPGSAPWSLDATYWHLRWGHSRSAGVEPQAVRSWIEPAFTGELTRSGLEPIFQLAYAVGIARSLGLPLDHDLVAATLEKLGYLGRNAATTQDDPGATELALGVMGAIGSAVPASLVRTINAHAVADDRALTPTEAINEATPALAGYSLLATDQRSVPAATVTDLEARIRTALGQIPADQVTVSALASLADSRARLGLVRRPPTAAQCAPASRSAGDPVNAIQLAVKARTLGCPGLPDQARPAPASGGWLASNAATDPTSLLESTRAGLSLVPAADRGDYLRRARAWARPYLRRSPSTNPLEAYLLGASRIAFGFGPAGALPAFDAGTVRPGVSLAAGLDADLLRQIPAEQRSVGAIRSLRNYGRSLMQAPGLNLLDAMALESISRLFNRPALHSRALRMASGLRTRSGEFRWALHQGDPDLQSDALGAWLTDRVISEQPLRRTGECVQDVCTQTQRVIDGETSVTATAILHQCRVRGCGGRVPFYLE